MSKLMVHLAMLPTKAVVNAFTWTTLPLYVAIQRPWRRLKLSKSFGVQATKDSKGQIIYSRPSPTELKHPFIGRPTLNQMLPLLNPAQEALGFREVISEQAKLDPKNGKSAKVEGKNFTKIELAKYYQWYTVGQVIDRVDSLARGFKEMGIAQGEKVIIYAENSVEWFCLALALQRINAITVTLPSILNNDGVLYGINQSKSRYLITSHELLPRIEQICSKLDNLNKIIYIPSSQNSPSDDTKSALNLLSSKYQLMTLDQLQMLGNQIASYDFPIPHPDDTTLIVYTSGTTGNPKGVMMSHRNLHETILNFIRFEHETKVPLFGNTTFAAYLPMSHLLGYVLNFASFLSKDSKLALCSASTILDSSPAHIDDQQLGDFSLLKPQFIAMVPLVLNRLVKDIYRSLAEKSSLAPPLFNYLMDYKIRWTGRGFDTPIINRLVCQRINRQFGGNVKAMLVSSAPLHAKTQAFVQAALNIKLLQYYGATEVTAGSHMMLPSDLNCGEVGVPMHSFRYYLKDWPEGDYQVTDKPNSRGEIVLGGPNIAQGYYDMPEQTEEAFKVDEEGTHWFETGDIGEVLPNGTLKIIDRKKDLTKLANGKFVSLGKIESGLRSSPLVENICICTNPYSNHLTAIVSPNHQSLISLAQQHSIPNNQALKQLCANSKLIHHVHLSITLKGQELGLSPKEIPTTITLVPEEWTADNNLLTAALKLKRKQVHAFYSKQIEQMFQDTKNVE